MTKTILAALTIALGVSAGALGASAAPFDGYADWQIQLFQGEKGLNR